ncbi:hypothetical protein [Desulfopila aestuarii]|uniref:Uncharacterized protein n=1 Tax=Desulfopila aestuarii DSM 18488 TaxID=1121416 RepID=A0A1M7Y1M8_9BACT|nr:hypothetical protein [Desulfopila aestuarii]SHO45732.1 hypothetical protein SAMN02745220_01189 [Desulfopila aestuarii DSM 18488]
MNNKKIICMLVGLAFLAPASSAFSAGTYADIVDASGTVSINDTLAGDGSLKIDLSPGVSMSLFSDAAEFAVTTLNTSSQAAYRMEYGIWSGRTGYYQQANDTEASFLTPAPTFDGTTNPFGSTWIYMGNAGAE